MPVQRDRRTLARLHSGKRGRGPRPPARPSAAHADAAGAPAKVTQPQGGGTQGHAKSTTPQPRSPAAPAPLALQAPGDAGRPAAKEGAVFGRCKRAARSRRSSCSGRGRARRVRARGTLSVMRLFDDGARWPGVVLSAMYRILEGPPGASDQATLNSFANQRSSTPRADGQLGARVCSAARTIKRKVVELK